MPQEKRGGRMGQAAGEAVVVGWSAAAAGIAVAAIALSLAALLLLHVLSPEYAWSWRMVSEYANGRYPWLLTVVFLSWAAASFALIWALWPLASTALGKAGLIFLLLAGIGQVMGGAFDINHKLHGPAAIIGIPSLCIAAVLVTMAMARYPDIVAPPLWSAHLPWISFALMLGTFALFLSALARAGVDLSAQTGPLAGLPVGVSGYVGWANRLIFASSYLWAVLAALAVIRR
jgi:uncharacterized protein DUF998